MEPFAYHGETVIARPEERLEWMVKDRVYVIVSVRGIHLKIFVKILSKSLLTSILLINPLHDLNHYH